MIDFSQLPLDITGHIQKFREFLNLSWDHVIYTIMEEHDWDDDGWFIDNWMQVNWELLVERELLGPDLGLTQFSTVSSGKSILHPDRVPRFNVIGKLQGNQKDIKTQKDIPKDVPLLLFSFAILDEKGKNITFGPPFDLARLVNEKTQDLYAVPVAEVRFILNVIQE